MEWKYVKVVADKNVIEKFAGQKGVELPEELVDFIFCHNNGRPSVKLFDTDKTKERVMKKVLSYNNSDIETVYESFEVLKKENNNLYPIANDPFGNIICYNTSDHNIDLWLHESNTCEYIASSIDEFLHKLY